MERQARRTSAREEHQEGGVHRQVWGYKAGVGVEAAPARWDETRATRRWCGRNREETAGANEEEGAGAIQQRSFLALTHTPRKAHPTRGLVTIAPLFCARPTRSKPPCRGADSKLRPLPRSPKVPAARLTAQRGRLHHRVLPWPRRNETASDVSRELLLLHRTLPVRTLSVWRWPSPAHSNK